MQPQSNQDYKQLLTAVIKKQIVILGPDITLSKARNVKGLTVADDGTVTNVDGSPQEVTQSLIDQFVQLSGLIVKKTMEPLLSMSQPVTQQPVVSQPTPPAEAQVAQPVTTTITQPSTTIPVAIPTPITQPTPPLTQPEPTPTPQVNPMPQPTPAPVQPEPVSPAEPVIPTPAVPSQPEPEQPTPPAPVESASQPKPANNPLAA